MARDLRWAPGIKDDRSSQRSPHYLKALRLWGRFTFAPVGIPVPGFCLLDRTVMEVLGLWVSRDHVAGQFLDGKDELQDRRTEMTAAYTNHFLQILSHTCV